MNLIVNVDRNWAIGFQNHLLVRIPTDMKQFRQRTVGKTIVMGRKTLESFPGKMPLEKRTNIVLTKDKFYDAHGAKIVHSMNELKDMLKEYPDEEIYVVGGESIYRALLPYCDTAYVTRVDYAYEADTYFPDLEKDSDWELVWESEELTCFDLEYRFTLYKRKTSAFHL